MYMHTKKKLWKGFSVCTRNNIAIYGEGQKGNKQENNSTVERVIKLGTRNNPTFSLTQSN
jgi:hypothetical protein